MRKAFVAGLLLVSSSACALKLIFAVRHAERADGGAGPKGSDPPLSAAGEARAKKLAAMLGDAGIAAIYATEFRRTRDTAAPIAKRLGRDVQITPARDTAKLVARLRERHAKDIVLVVGHSNSLPDLVAALRGPEITIGDQEYDALFILVPATGAFSRVRF